MPLALLPLLLACAPARLEPEEEPAFGEDGLHWFWGDLHAHSAWSFDGCENPALDCAHDADGPATAFYERARARGLDFAALTDHAEPDLYQYGPDALHEEGATLEIWNGQQLAVVKAEDGPVLPILGYEWTANHNATNPDGPGTHRTVLLGAPTACAAYRVAGRSLPPDGHIPDVGDRAFLQGDRLIEPTPIGLWRALDAATLSPACTPTRWLSFAHHPAYRNPQRTDWSEPENAPLRESLVEIHSEHGSSECYDPVAYGCDFAINHAQGYSSRGSVQAALDHGFQLGFVGGTDSHDSHPGSVEDGPSYVAQWSDDEEGGLIQQFAPGALTGVLSHDPLDRDALFDALQARRTLATSGPRVELTAWAVGRNGDRYLPGEHIPRWNQPALLVLVLGELDPRGEHRWEDFEEIVIERVSSGGRVVAIGPGEAFGDRWDPRADETWTYLRVRLLRGAASSGHPSLNGEERLWLSPWFTDPAGAGCQSAPAPPLVLLPLALLYNRKRPTATSHQASASPAGSAQAQARGWSPRVATQAKTRSRKGS